MKRGNIFEISSSRPNALTTIANQILRILSDPNIDQDNIEIEIKYAEFQYFSRQRYIDYVNRCTQQDYKKVAPMCGFVQEQRFWFKSSLKKLSYQNVIKLNQLGRQVYLLKAGFDELKYQKFYYMREYLTNQCQFNKNLKDNNILIPDKPKNIYHQYSQIGDNRTFEMVQEGELRLDVIYKDQSSELNGRYSYSKSTGWVKTKKKSLIKEQIDLMLSQKTFRLAIAQQLQTQVSYQQLELLKQQMVDNGFKKIEVRLKRTLKCTKSGILQYSLSEVYQPNNSSGFIPNLEDISSYLTQQANIIDAYIQKKFQYFYECHPTQNLDPLKSQIKFQIESQFTKKGVKLLKQNAKRGQLKQIYYEVEQSIDSLYNLFYADHSVKTNQAKWMDKILSDNTNGEKAFPDQRLMNEFGSYMHNILFEQMTLLRHTFQ